jgi:hypothetical protein
MIRVKLPRQSASPRAIPPISRACSRSSPVRRGCARRCSCTCRPRQQQLRRRGRGHFLEKVVPTAPDIEIVVGPLGDSSPGYPPQSDEVMSVFAAAAERNDTCAISTSTWPQTSPPKSPPPKPPSSPTASANHPHPNPLRSERRWATRIVSEIDLCSGRSSLLPSRGSIKCYICAGTQ